MYKRMIFIPRNEYPRPQLVRDNWLCLNGEWDFEIDDTLVGEELEYYKADGFSRKIVVPFCPESKLSGVCHKGFMNCVWYRREVKLEKKTGFRTLLHIGAADYETTVWVNGKCAGNYRGGYSSFSFDITELIQDGENVITVSCRDDIRSREQPYGKQSPKYESHGMIYTRTTGIYATVWIEEVPTAHIDYTKYTCSIATGEVFVEAICKNANGMKLCAEASFEGVPMGCAETTVIGDRAFFSIKLRELHLWDIGKGNLYDLKLKLGEDEVKSYFGMREISYGNGGELKINGKARFWRFILDQGFNPDGIYTYPDEKYLEADILRGIDMGFDGARLHQRVFEPLTLYYCDKHGYAVFGEFGDWGLNLVSPNAFKTFSREWLSVMKRDYNHPSVIGWCPFNETHDTYSIIGMIYELTKQFDTTRPVIDASGWCHSAKTDILDAHDYEQDAVRLSEKYGDNGSDNPSISFLSEYGGILWAPDQYGVDGWGYGIHPENEEAFIERFRSQTHALLDSGRLCAFCYTQLTDVEEEKNGLYTYDRKPKFPPEVIRAIVSKKAKIEQ